MKMMKSFIILVFTFLSKFVAQAIEETPLPADTHYSMNVNMPDVRPADPDSYICTAKKLNPQESYIVQYEPDADSQRVHHMLLFGCKSLHYQSQLYPGHWNCAHGDHCKKMTIMYGWAKNAPAMSLPPDVGFLTGGNSSIQYVVLQIHYSEPLPEGSKDNSGLKLHMTSQRQKYVTGIRLLLEDTAEIPPKKPSYHVDVNCKFDEGYTIHPFAYRVHTHRLGVVVSGYKYSTVNDSWTFLAKGNPQWPQAFYPLHRLHTVTNQDILAARCTYNSSDMDDPVKIGSKSNNEMCNLYLMYYTEYKNARSGQSPPCVGVQFPNLVRHLPLDSDVPLPRNPELEQQAFGHHGNHHLPAVNEDIQDSNHAAGQDAVSHQHHSTVKEMFTESGIDNDYKFREVYGWPAKNLIFGQIVAVTVNADGNVVIFHRGNHVWNERSFDVLHNYLLIDEGPVEEATILVIDAVTGLVLKEWGSKLFYMPHGLFIAHDGNFWVTDVAMHQVFKFLETNLDQPVLTLGEKFVNGKDNSHFCKPASVAVSKDGEIYVADGYCNARIMRFSADGKFLSQFGKRDSPFDRNGKIGTFRIPHKVTLLEDRNLVCVADRENGRIQCFTMTMGRFRFEIKREEFNGALYSIDYSEEKGLLFAVSGEDYYQSRSVKAFVFNITNQRLLNVFAPQSGTFTRPHDIAVLPNAEEAYVCEIGPNIVWKFMRIYHKSTKKVLNNGGQHPSTSSTSSPVKDAAKKLPVDLPLSEDTTKADEDMTSFETSLIIMSLLAIPVLCLVLVTVIIRLKKRGKLQHCSLGHLKGWLGGYRTPHPQDKFNLGNLLNPHKGFDPVAVEESDGGDDDGSESDIEEFNTTAKKT